MAKITTAVLQKMKQQGEKISMLTAYDASFAKLFAEQGVEVLLIGDSLGMVLQGHSDTLPVTISDIAYHTRAVRAGANEAFVIADMPFMSYGTPEAGHAKRHPPNASRCQYGKVGGGGFSATHHKSIN
ncbi:3-methyl-2-oxobutanoate hydroxymethyltransferase [Alishewanella longhuensis]